MFNRLCINDLFALQRYKNFWTFLLFPLAFRALGTNCLQVGNFSNMKEHFDGLFFANPKKAKKSKLTNFELVTTDIYNKGRVTIGTTVLLCCHDKIMSGAVAFKRKVHGTPCIYILTKEGFKLFEVHKYSNHITLVNIDLEGVASLTWINTLLKVFNTPTSYPPHYVFDDVVL